MRYFYACVNRGFIKNGNIYCAGDVHVFTSKKERDDFCAEFVAGDMLPVTRKMAENIFHSTPGAYMFPTYIW